MSPNFGRKSRALQENMGPRPYRDPLKFLSRSATAGASISLAESIDIEYRISSKERRSVYYKLQILDAAFNRGQRSIKKALIRGRRSIQNEELVK